MNHRPRPAADTYELVVARGLERATEVELRALGVREHRTRHGRLTFRAVPELAAQVFVWTRTTTAMRRVLAVGHAPNAGALKAVARRVDWAKIRGVVPGGRIDASVHRSALQSRDLVGRIVGEAVTEALPNARAAAGSVDCTLRVELVRNRASIAVPLHRSPLSERGYRLETGAAPLREDVAAAAILLSGWTADQPLVDPMCGAGTQLIEAALMRAARPARTGEAAAPNGWPRLGALAWRRVLKPPAALASRRATTLPPLVGADQKAGALGVTRRNAERAGVRGTITLVRADWNALPGALEAELLAPGTLILNPPYGKRLKPDEATRPEALAQRLRRSWGGWRAALVLPFGALDRLDVPVHSTYRFRQGGLERALVVTQRL